MEFRILGPLEVWRDDARLELTGAKRRSLLAILLLNAGEVVSTDRLIDELWAGRPPSTAVKTVQVYVSQLRKTLGEGIIVTRRPGYTVELQGLDLDLDRFQQLASEGRRALAAGDPRTASETLREALSLWRGPPLSDLAYEPFAQAELARLEELRLAAAEDRIEADLQAGYSAELVAELQGLAVRHPLRERLRGQLMLALYRSGRQAEALEAYRDARRALVDELGIEPAKALKDLEQAILEHDPELEAPTTPAPEPGKRPTPAEVEERKLVTVLFADLGMSSDPDPDPERMRAFLDRVQAEVVGELETAGARIEWAVGDALLVTFGASAAKEDHAERALHAALAARSRLDAAFGNSVSVRMAVESGEVVTGGGAEGRPPITGAPVALAARLARSAAIGEILVGERVAASVRGAFEVHTRNGDQVLVRALDRVRPRGVLGAARTFVNREGELDLLKVTYDRVAQDEQPHLVTIVGDAGVGKTSVLWAFRDSLGPTAARWYVGRCLAYGRAVTYRPLGQILKQRFGIGDSDPPDAIVERLGAGRILGLTLGLDPGEELHPLEARDRLRRAWVGLLEEIAADGAPAIVVLEDLHWADEALLELLDQVVRDASGPLMLLSTARPELVDRVPAWGARRRNVSRIWLEPLSRADAERMLDEIASELPSTVRELVLDRAEGNPFFVEEVLQSLLDSGKLRRENGGWSADRLSGAVEVPDSIQAVIAARVDLLPIAHKVALQAAAVVGRSFWESAVTELVEEPPEDLGLIEERDFVRRSPTSSLKGQQEYLFKHALTRDVAYASLSVGRRARLHAGFAEWLERARAGPVELAPLIAHHYAEAIRPDLADIAWGGEEHRAAGLRESARRWLRRAGQLAFGRFEMKDAADLFEQAAGLAKDDDDRLEMWLSAARASQERFDMTRFREDMERAVEVARDGRAEAEVWARLALEGSRPYMWKQPPSRDEVERWTSLALQHPEAGTWARARALAARSILHPDTGAEDGHEALALAEELGDPALISYAAEAILTCATAAGDFEKAREYADRGVATVGQAADQDHDREAGRYMFAAFAYLRLGLMAEGRRLAEQHDALASRLTVHHEVHGVAILMLVEFLECAWEAARDLTPRAEAAAAANADTPCQFNWRMLLMAALAHAELGDEAVARRLEEHAAEIASMGGPFEKEPALLRLALLRGDLAWAEDLVAANPVHDFHDVDYPAARLDAFVALRDQERAEAEAPQALRSGGYTEPFALRALGVLREERPLVERALARFEELGLTRRAEETRVLT
jgi:DNA-binding SARP family transcriptional activator